MNVHHGQLVTKTCNIFLTYGLLFVTTSKQAKIALQKQFWQKHQIGSFVETGKQFLSNNGFPNCLSHVH